MRETFQEYIHLSPESSSTFFKFVPLISRCGDFPRLIYLTQPADAFQVSYYRFCYIGINPPINMLWLDVKSLAMPLSPTLPVLEHATPINSLALFSKRIRLKMSSVRSGMVWRSAIFSLFCPQFFSLVRYPCCWI